MKFYDCSTAPSPRRVRVFIAEKGLNIETVQVDLRNREQLESTFREINPNCTVPVLELDDGTRLWDSNSICVYLEAAFPEPNLLGTDAKEKGVIASWNRVMEWDGFAAVAEILRNSATGFQDRALTGPVGHQQIPALADRGRRRLQHFYEILEARLGESPFVASDRYTVADITGAISVEFAERVKQPAPDDFANLKGWHGRVAARPSFVA